MKSMAQKRARHYGETKTVCAVFLLVLGLVLGLCLTLLWPQSFLVTIFDSRLMYQLVLSVDDYYSCSDKFKDFVIDEPKEDYQMMSFYLFSVTNPGQVIQQGYKPDLKEMGPFGYVKNTYRYDIYFSDDSSLVTFKEYSRLEAVTDPNACEAMFFRMERNSLGKGYCASNECLCQDVQSEITVINPLFLKRVWQDKPFRLLAQYAGDVFAEVKVLLDEPFTEAVKGHLVSRALKEVYQFRSQFQLVKVLNKAYENLAAIYTVEEFIDASVFPGSCGLSLYGITSCPFNPTNVYETLQTVDVSSIGGYPLIRPFFNASNRFSVLNEEEGIAKWLALAWLFDYVNVNSDNGYTMISTADAREIHDDFLQAFLETTYGSSTTLNATHYTAGRIAVLAMAKFVGLYWISPFYLLSNKLQLQAYEEFTSTYSPVICSPLLIKCVWQFGYMNQYHNASFSISNTLAATMIDLTQEVNTNPNSLYIDNAAPGWYNAFLYITKVFNPSDDFNIDCTNYGDTLVDALIARPAGLWGADTGANTVNKTALHATYSLLSQTVKDKYIFLATNISYLIHSVFRTETAFHDEFVVRYLNKFKDPDFAHNFTVGNWSELGLAQWGGGFVTYALENVRSTKQIVRDGMWDFGEDRYHTNFLEYASWCARQGFPYHWIYSVDNARTLLNALARNDSVGVDFREHIFYRGTTLIGDGTNFVNNIGAVGEVTFTPEANLGDFTCTGEVQEACDLLNFFQPSSAAQCEAVNDLYSRCFREYVFLQNRWIANSFCSDFETSITNPSKGIPCDDVQVFGHNHPYTKSRGNVVAQMLYSLTYLNNLQYGLWCKSPTECGFDYGGMFVNATVQEILFDGFTDASVLYFLQKEYGDKGVNFECVSDAYDVCGVKNYRCNNYDGIYMVLTNTQEKYHISYSTTPRDEYFTPHYVVQQSTSQLLWPFSSNATLAAADQMQMLMAESIDDILIIPNPFWTAYPSWDSNHSDFLKFYQCSKRMFGGMPGVFYSCDQTILSGTDGKAENVLQLHSFYGNKTIQAFNDDIASNISFPEGIDVNGSTVNQQYTPYYWSGFYYYPYSYLGLSQGVNYTTMKNPLIFSKDAVMSLALTQSPLIFKYNREFAVQIPFTTGSADVSENNPKHVFANVRRFVEHVSSWQPYRTLASPKDSYGMGYNIPVGMASLQRYADFPVFVGKYLGFPFIFSLFCSCFFEISFT